MRDTTEQPKQYGKRGQVTTFAMSQPKEDRGQQGGGAAPKTAPPTPPKGGSGTSSPKTSK